MDQFVSRNVFSVLFFVLTRYLVFFAHLDEKPFHNFVDGCRLFSFDLLYSWHVFFSLLRQVNETKSAIPSFQDKKNSEKFY